jgi:adenylate kinase family enzyme
MSLRSPHLASPGLYRLPACLQYKLVHISVGDLLREQVAQGTAAGVKAKDFMER